MKTVDVEYANRMLRLNCTPAPISIKKIVRVFSNDVDIMHAVLNLYYQGAFQNYHLFPENKFMIF